MYRELQGFFPLFAFLVETAIAKHFRRDAVAG